MIRDRRRITTIVFLLTICGASASHLLAQQSSSTVPQHPAVIKYDGDMALILAIVSETYQTTIGLEVDSKKPKSTVGFYLRDPSLADVLTAIVKAEPRYQWRDSPGVMEVSPLAGSSPLLDVIVERFNVVNVDDREAINYLLKLTEVQAYIMASSLNYQDSSRTGAEAKAMKFSLSLENVTMRQALNSIATQSGKRFWIFQTNKSGDFSISTSPR